MNFRIYITVHCLQGKVTRNEYGNVEMFLPSMLPPGGVHIRSESTELFRSTV